jgi:hypothetical protein
MIHKEMTIIDLGGDNWSRLMRLPRELAALRDDGDAEPRRVLLVVYRGLKVLKAMDALGTGRRAWTWWQSRRATRSWWRWRRLRSRASSGTPSAS